MNKHQPHLDGEALVLAGPIQLLDRSVQACIFRTAMTARELRELIAGGEGPRIEFMRDEAAPERIATTFVAFANSHGGQLLFGVDPGGRVVGTTRPSLEQWIRDTVFARYVHPWILPSYEEIEVDDGKRVAVVTVTQGVTKPYVVRHQDREEMYVRLGSTSRRATREQQARLFASGGMVHTEAQPVSGSTLADLSRPRLENYLRDVLLDRELPTSDDEWVERLSGLGFITRVEGLAAACSIAGLVLFGSGPRRLLRQAGVRWMAFGGADKEYQALDDTLIDAPLVGLWSGRPSSGAPREPGLFEVFVDRVRPFLTEESDALVDGLRRERTWQYPVEAVREAVVNALAHRDWTRANEVEVVRYADRLEVTSPGALQNSMTVEKMLAGQRSARNSIVVDVLRDYGYVDARGMGVRRKIVPKTTAFALQRNAESHALRVRMVQDVDELRRALEYPWEKWTVFLPPARRELAERTLGGPARVSGSAGTGKTIGPARPRARRRSA